MDTDGKTVIACLSRQRDHPTGMGAREQVGGLRLKVRGPRGTAPTAVWHATPPFARQGDV